MVFPNGSEWRRWDLHVHTKGTLKADNFKSHTFEDFCIVLFRKALENGISAIGITDYFSIDNYKNVLQFVDDIEKFDNFSKEESERIREIFLIPNVELRMLPATDSGRMINIHCLFNPNFLDSLENHFFGSLEHSGGDGKIFKMNRQGMIELGHSYDPNLSEQDAFQRGISTFAVSHGDLQELKDTDVEFKENVIIAVSNSNQDGASGLQKHYDMFEGIKTSSLDGVRQAIYKISDCVFSSNPKDALYFSGKGADNHEAVISKCGTLKPCIHGSDAHTEDKLFNPSEKRHCWIKADLTFNGLRQILFEPFPGNRVLISQTKPDQKDDFKVIKKIAFHDTDDFPNEVVLNPNLCSIIGSRSSGKSALLAYIADSIDTEQAREKMENGPGEGFPWDNVDFDYSIEWANGRPNSQSPGKLVYIPQNFLYEMSGKPEEIKNKILPVLTKKLPQVSLQYSKVQLDIKRINGQIQEIIGIWFSRKKQISEISDDLKDLGAEKSVQKEKEKIDGQIKIIKEKYKLKADDIIKLQKLNDQVLEYEQRISQINIELETIGEDGEKGEFFKEAKIHLVPSVEELPDSLHEKINQKLEGFSKKIISDSNLIVKEHITRIQNELSDTNKKLINASDELDTLKKKKEKNEELDELIEKSSELKSILKKIKEKTSLREEVEHKLSGLNKQLKAQIKLRNDLIEDLINDIKAVDQTNIQEMKFGIEAEITENDLETVQSKVDTRRNSDFVNSRTLDVEKIRKSPDKFLETLVAGDQKLNKGHTPQTVAEDVLTLTEELLFTAIMEGDRIGGFSEPTMTPGKRALFALRLLLAESEDTWPLLIDQPEDDLDSRSIYDEIVPFLREKKQERQIIMVSHNANLVIGADSEQIIVANRHGEDRKNKDGKQFNYISGSIENTKDPDRSLKDTLMSQGIREHACEILEGGELAFEQRRNRYDIKQIPH